MNWRYSAVAEEPARVATVESVATDVGPPGKGAPRGGSRIAKRLYDTCFATVGLTLLSPLLVLIGLVVKLGDGGPAL